MRLILATICSLAMSSAALADDDVTKTLMLSDFERIHIAGVYDLSVRAGGDFSVEISGPEKEVARVKADVKNGTLKLSQKQGGPRWGRNRHGVDAVITMPMLVELEVSGVVDGDIRGIDAETFELSISGVGDVELSGQCGMLDAAVSGVGDLDAKDLKCDRVDISVSGVGGAAVFARDSVDAAVSGMGDIDIYGKPDDVSKSSSIFADITVH